MPMEKGNTNKIRLFVNSWGKSELKQKRRMEQAIAKKLSLVQRQEIIS